MLNGARQKELAEYDGITVINEPIVVDENIITSYCPQTAVEVAFKLLEMLTDQNVTGKTSLAIVTVNRIAAGGVADSIESSKIKAGGAAMRTVTQVSDLAGVSVRMLHYYDKIGLLKRSEITDAGYRLYDNEALKALQQILFFKELDIPLKEVKKIIASPYFDKMQALGNQNPRNLSLLNWL